MEQTFSQKLSFCHWGNWIREEKWLTQGGVLTHVQTAFLACWESAQSEPLLDRYMHGLCLLGSSDTDWTFLPFAFISLIPWPRARNICYVVLKKVVVSQHNGKGKKKTNNLPDIPSIYNPNFKCINFAECHGNIHICFSVPERYFGNYWLMLAWAFSSFSYRNAPCSVFILCLCLYSSWE